MKIEVPTLSARPYSSYQPNWREGHNSVLEETSDYILVEYDGNAVGYVKTGFLGYDERTREVEAQEAFVELLKKVFGHHLDGEGYPPDARQQ